MNKSTEKYRRKKEKEKSYPFSYWNKKKGSKWLARFLIKRDKVNFAARLPSTNWPYSDGGRGLFRVVSLERACSKDRRERKLARAKFVTVQSRRPFSANGGGGFFWMKSSISYCAGTEKSRDKKVSFNAFQNQPSLRLFSFFILLFKPRLSGRKFLSRKGGDVFQQGGPCARVLVQRISPVATTRGSCAQKFGFANCASF